MPTTYRQKSAPARPFRPAAQRQTEVFAATHHPLTQLKHFRDRNRAATAQRMGIEELENSALQMKSEDELEDTLLQRKPNNTGLPDQLKSGIENLSGYSMDDVKVHYNSSKPAALQAHAYAQGTDIHMAPGQEKHLPHEAWHVVQQKQGRVRPTMQLQGLGVNDDVGLEREADVMGGRAMNY